jgi:hypothetical protein
LLQGVNILISDLAVDSENEGRMSPLSSPDLKASADSNSDDWTSSFPAPTPRSSSSSRSSREPPPSQAIGFMNKQITGSSFAVNFTTLSDSQRGPSPRRSPRTSPLGRTPSPLDEAAAKDVQEESDS